jgi:hypothetical protein
LLSSAIIDNHPVDEDTPSVVAIKDAYAKLSQLSEERAGRVVALINDLAELESIENAQDLAAAHEALSDGEQPVPWEEAKARLDAVHGHD